MNKETRGRKPNADKGKEVKISRGVYLYPKQLKRIEKRFGSLTKYIAAKLLDDNI
jgi:hypothetical protein